MSSWSSGGAMAVLAAATAIAASAAAPQWTEPAVSPEVRAAMDKADGGDPADLLKLADGGRVDAQYYAGGMLIFGRGQIARDPARGCAYEEKASATRADAMHLVGECWRRGLAGKLDKQKAQAAYARAAEMGYPKSKCALRASSVSSPPPPGVLWSAGCPGSPCAVEPPSACLPWPSAHSAANCVKGQRPPMSSRQANKTYRSASWLRGKLLGTHFRTAFAGRSTSACSCHRTQRKWLAPSSPASLAWTRA